MCIDTLTAKRVHTVKYCSNTVKKYRRQLVSIKFLIKGDVSYVAYCKIVQGLQTLKSGNRE